MLLIKINRSKFVSFSRFVQSSIWCKALAVPSRNVVGNTAVDWAEPRMAGEGVEIPLDSCLFLISNYDDQPLRILSQVDACTGVSEVPTK